VLAKLDLARVAFELEFGQVMLAHEVENLLDFV
jgi:hypothetical protein